MFSTPEFWVLVSFLIFIGVLLYFRVPRIVVDLLDSRIEAIRREIDEAARLREQAQKLLARHEARRKQAEKEVEEILRVAREEAEALSLEMRREFDEMITRRRAAAEDAIRQAEYEAVKEIREHAANLSVAAAERLLEGRIKGARATRLVEESAEAIRKHLH
jgi:F-type H+-transporting ATPase subunit b